MEKRVHPKNQHSLSLSSIAQPREVEKKFLPNQIESNQIRSDQITLDHQPSRDKGRQAVEGAAHAEGTRGVVITLLVLVGLVGVTLATVVDVAEHTRGLLAVLLDRDLTGVPVDGDLSAVADAARQHTGVASTLVLEGLRAARAAVHAGVIDDQRAVVHVFVGWRAGVLDVHVGARNGLREGEDSTELEELHF